MLLERATLSSQLRLTFFWGWFKLQAHNNVFRKGVLQMQDEKFDPNKHEHMLVLKDILLRAGLNPGSSDDHRKTATSIKNAAVGLEIANLETFVIGRLKPPTAKRGWQPDIIESGHGQEGFLVLLYGVPGVGKSTLAAQAPVPFFVDLEDGLKTIRCKKSRLLTDLESIYKVVDWFVSSEFETLVIDSITVFETIIHDVVALENGKAHIGLIGFQNGYKFAIQHFQTLINKLKLICKAGKNVILVGHSTVSTITNPQGESYNQYTIGLHKSANDFIWAHVDAALFCNVDLFVKKNSSDDYIAKRKDVRIYTTMQGFCVAKNRYNMPETLEMTPDVYRYMLK